MRLKKIIGVGLIAVLALTLAACGNNASSVDSSQDDVVAAQDDEESSGEAVEETEVEAEEETQEEKAETEETEGKEGAKDAEEAASPSLAENVTISDFTVSYFSRTENGVDSCGYVLGMTISNGNDMSCDVSPSLQVNVTLTNNYGEQKTEDAKLLHSEPAVLYSPYSRYDLNESNGDQGYLQAENLEVYVHGEYLSPVGLAPNETKTVYYYVQQAYLDGHADRIDFDENNNRINDVTLLDVDTEEASCSYVPVNEWPDSLEIDKYYVPEGTVMDAYWLFFLNGSITNKTSDKWKYAQAQFDFIENGEHAVASSVSYKERVQCFDYVNTGETVDFMDVSMDDYFNAHFTSNIAWSSEDENTELELVPALLWYEKEEDAWE